jgi:hypothetical protein
MVPWFLPNDSASRSGSPTDGTKVYTRFYNGSWLRQLHPPSYNESCNQIYPTLHPRHINGVTDWALQRVCLSSRCSNIFGGYISFLTREAAVPSNARALTRIEY